MSISAASTPTVKEDEMEECGPQPIARLEVKTALMKPLTNLHLFREMVLMLAISRNWRKLAITLLNRWLLLQRNVCSQSKAFRNKRPRKFIVKCPSWCPWVSQPPQSSIRNVRTWFVCQQVPRNWTGFLEEALRLAQSLNCLENFEQGKRKFATL